MRFAFVGAGEVTVATARILIGRGHEVIIIEKEDSIIDQLSETLDCSFLKGDGSKPAILGEVSPSQTDILFCLTDSDQINLIASLVGRNLGFNRVVTSIQDREFEGICRELGLEDTIVPSRTISRYLADMAEGVDILELSTVIKGEARFFSFTTDQRYANAEELKLPQDTKVVCIYRSDKFFLADEATNFHKDDEVVVLTHSDNLPALKERWRPKQGKSGSHHARMTKRTDDE
jgi:trk system potassium uptake protein TrkA